MERSKYESALAKTEINFRNWGPGSVWRAVHMSLMKNGRRVSLSGDLVIWGEAGRSRVRPGEDGGQALGGAARPRSSIENEFEFSVWMNQAK